MSATMKAVRRDDEGHPVFVEVPRPQPGPGEVLVRILRAGICSTDLEILKGYVPHFSSTLGHEFVGSVAAHGPDVTGDLPVGSAVVGEINLPCRQCSVCEAGGIARRNHCPNRTVLGIINRDGTMAEYMALPADNLFAVPENVSLRAATFAEPLAAAYRVVEQVEDFRPSSKLAVVGDGKLGLLITEVLRAVPHERLVVFGRHGDKMALLSDDVTRVVVGSETELADYENQFDFVVEASGSPSGLILAGQLTKPLGTVILKTTCATAHSDLNTAPFVVKEITIIGSRCGNFDMALKALASGSIDVEKFIAKRCPFEKALEAFAEAAKPGILKVQLVMDEDKD